MKKYDYLNLAAVALSILGILLEVVGGVVFSPAVSVGVNTNLSPVLLIGLGVIVIALVPAIWGSVVTERHGLNKTLSTAAIYLAVLAVMFAVVFLLLTMFWPVLNPANG